MSLSLHTAYGIVTRMNNPIDLILRDHEQLQALLQVYENMEPDAPERVALIHSLTNELSLHTEMEETLCYPRFREVLNGEDERRVETAYSAHEKMKDLIEQLSSIAEITHVDEEHVKELIACAREHIKEEERDILPKVFSKLSTEQLGALGDDIIIFKESRRGVTP